MQTRGPAAFCQLGDLAGDDPLTGSCVEPEVTQLIRRTALDTPVDPLTIGAA